jgi:hypothetical protein
MAITIKFNLKTTQIDTVNIFVHYDFNKVVYIKLLLGFNKEKTDKVLYLKKPYTDYNNPLYYGRRISQAC